MPPLAQPFPARAALTLGAVFVALACLGGVAGRAAPPPGSASATKPGVGPVVGPLADTPSPAGTLADRLGKAEGLGLFAKLWSKAGVQLQPGRTYLILAPNDAAWKALPPGVLEELAAPAAHEQLVRLVERHIVPLPAGTDVATAPMGATGLATLEGTIWPVAPAAQGGWTVSEAHPSGAAIPASDGRLQPIDRVLMPRTAPAPPVQPAPGTPTLAR